MNTKFRKRLETKLFCASLKVTQPKVDFAWDKRCNLSYTFLQMGISSESTVIKSVTLLELYETIDLS